MAWLVRHGRPGYDWQFTPSWVFGVFADGQFGSIRGPIRIRPRLHRQQKLRRPWAAGGRLGCLVAPNVLSYVNGGYSGAHCRQHRFSTRGWRSVRRAPNGFNRNGCFVGGGVENNLNIFGISSPGWFMKTEYRSAFYNARPPDEFVRRHERRPASHLASSRWTQTITTSLVYRFNWTGPVVAKY